MHVRVQDWLDLTLKQKLPSSLLVLSRVFTITGEERPTAAALETAIGSLPTEVVEDALAASESGQKLERLKREEELIAEERKLQAVASHPGPASAGTQAQTHAGAADEHEPAAVLDTVASTHHRIIEDVKEVRRDGCVLISVTCFCRSLRRSGCGSRLRC